MTIDDLHGGGHAVSAAAETARDGQEHAPSSSPRSKTRLSRPNEGGTPVTIIVYCLKWVDGDKPGTTFGYRGNLKVAEVTFMTDRKVRITVENPATVKKKSRDKKSRLKRSIRMDITGGMLEAQQRADILYAVVCLR